MPCGTSVNPAASAETGSREASMDALTSSEKIRFVIAFMSKPSFFIQSKRRNTSKFVRSCGGQ